MATQATRANAPAIAQPNTGVANLSPSYFALVMATGIVSIGAELRGLHGLAVALLWLNVVAYVALWALTLTRLLRYPRLLAGDLVSHQKGAAFLTIVAGTNVLGSQFGLVAGRAGIAAVLWWVGLVLWAVLMYAFVTAVTVGIKKPGLGTGISGVWLLLVVSTESVAVLGTGVAARVGLNGVLFFSLIMHLVGAMLYIVIIGLIFYRWAFFEMSPEQASPPYWINMGALAITTLAGASLLGAADSLPLLTGLSPFLKGTTLLFWGFATWWIPLLIVVGVWRHVVQRVPLRYDPQFWALVFPLGMYSVATTKLLATFDLSFSWLPTLFFWAAAVAWTVTFVAMVRHLVSSRISPTRRG